MGIIEKQSIQDIADAIRNRNGLTTLYKPREMDEAILNLYSTTKVNNMLDYILPCYEKEATSYTIQYADADRPGSITKLEGNTTQEGTPTPSNPIEVNTVSGDNEVVVSNEQHVTGNSYRVDFGGKNILPNTATTQTINGITFTVNEDKTITLNGTSTNAIELPIGMCESLDIGTYKGNCASNSSTSSYYIRLGTNNTSSSGWLANITYNTTVTLNSITNVYALLIVKNGVSLNNVTIYPQLEKRKSSNSIQSLCK